MVFGSLLKKMLVIMTLLTVAHAQELGNIREHLTELSISDITHSVTNHVKHGINDLKHLFTGHHHHHSNNNTPVNPKDENNLQKMREANKLK